jgi:hypothetical protein
MLTLFFVHEKESDESCSVKIPIEGSTVAEVVKNFGDEWNNETLDEFRYPQIKS